MNSLFYSTFILPYQAPGGGGGAVNSVFGRTGTVTAQSGDYTASQVTNVPAGGIASTNVQAAINELYSLIIGGGGNPGGGVGAIQYQVDATTFGGFGSYDDETNDLTLPGAIIFESGFNNIRVLGTGAGGQVRNSPAPGGSEEFLQNFDGGWASVPQVKYINNTGVFTVNTNFQVDSNGNAILSGGTSLNIFGSGGDGGITLGNGTNYGTVQMKPDGTLDFSIAVGSVMRFLGATDYEYDAPVTLLNSALNLGNADGSTFVNLSNIGGAGEAIGGFRNASEWNFNADVSITDEKHLVFTVGTYRATINIDSGFGAVVFTSSDGYFNFQNQDVVVDEGLTVGAAINVYGGLNINNSDGSHTAIIQNDSFGNISFSGVSNSWTFDNRIVAPSIYNPTSGNAFIDVTNQIIYDAQATPIQFIDAANRNIYDTANQNVMSFDSALRIGIKSGTFLDFYNVANTASFSMTANGGIGSLICDFNGAILYRYDGHVQATDLYTGGAISAPFLGTDSSGKLVARSGSTATPGGADGQIQVNVGATLGAFSTLTYDTITNIFGANGATIDASGNLALPSAGRITLVNGAFQTGFNTDSSGQLNLVDSGNNTRLQITTLGVNTYGRSTLKNGSTFYLENSSANSSATISNGGASAQSLINLAGATSWNFANLINAAGGITYTGAATANFVNGATTRSIGTNAGGQLNLGNVLFVDTSGILVGGYVAAVGNVDIYNITDDANITISNTGATGVSTWSATGANAYNFDSITSAPDLKATNITSADSLATDSAGKIIKVNLVVGEIIGTGDGVTTIFNFAIAPIINSEEIFVSVIGVVGISGLVRVIRTSDYTISGVAVTFSSPPVSGARIIANSRN